MSRCFPFPPPGYESNHAELLAKEQLKEKKHKKEKRDKEKKEGKERKNKDKSKAKHKEKNDRREKHKDKKKDKDRDKEKNRASDDQRSDRSTGGPYEEKLGDGSWKVEEVMDVKLTEEFGRRIRDEEKGAADRILETASPSVQKRPDNMAPPATITDSVVKKTGIPGVTTKVEKERFLGNKMVPEFSTDQKRALGNQIIPGGEPRRLSRNALPPHVSSMEQKKICGMAHQVGEDRRSSGHELVPTTIFTEEQRYDGLARTVQKMDKRFEGEKINDRETVDGKRDKHKDKNREKRKEKKDKDKHKKKEKEKEKTKEKGENRHKEQHHKVTDSGKKDHVDSGRKDHVISLNFKPLDPLKDNGKSGYVEENNKKRNHIEVNGFLPETDVRPNKIPRSAPSSHPLQNGRTLPSCNVADGLYPAMKEGPKDAVKAQKVEVKEQKMNGRTITQSGLDLKPAVAVLKPSVTDLKPSVPDLKPSAAAESSRKVQASSISPHPDCKYLSKIYTVPKMDEWPENDNQEWLFSSKHLQTEAKADLEADDRPHVWAEAMQIDPLDVLALPYVLPY